MKKRAKKPKWKKEDFFPIIARIINDRYASTHRFVRRDEIAVGLVGDSLARRLVDKAILETSAENIVDWFSAHFTGYKNGNKRFSRWGPIFDGYERAELGGHPAYKPTNVDAIHVFPDEVNGEVEFREGAMRRVLVNAYERDPGARKQCISTYGSDCFICKISFGGRYGSVARGFIHVHHLRQLSKIRKEYSVDPIKDLRPVCPNCHAVLHLRNPAYSIEEVVAFLGGELRTEH